MTELQPANCAGREQLPEPRGAEKPQTSSSLGFQPWPACGVLCSWLGPPRGEKQHLTTLTRCFSLQAQLKGERLVGDGCIVSLSLACHTLPLSPLPGQFCQWIDFFSRLIYGSFMFVYVIWLNTYFTPCTLVLAN